SPVDGLARDLDLVPLGDVGLVEGTAAVGAAFLVDCRSERPAKALSFTAAARWGGRTALGLLPARDSALGPLRAFLGVLSLVSSRLSPLGPPRRASGHGDRSVGRRPPDAPLPGSHCSGGESSHHAQADAGSGR